MREQFHQYQRIIVKVGTSTLTYANGQLNLQRIGNLVQELADLRNRGMDVILVTSGAGGTGASRMGMKKKPDTLPEKQALAAIGQGILMHIYEKFFAEYGKTVAQILLTREDLDDRRRYLNAMNALSALLQMGVLPIINENDTVATHELKFGDNDTLSAMVSGVVDADLLILLSDVNGLYDCDPRQNPEAKLIPEVTGITAQMEENSVTRGTAFSSGGMLTKLRAARICMNEGIPMVIANSSEKDIIRRIIDGENIGTLFVPQKQKVPARKKWIAFGRVQQGTLIVDEGCEKALLHKGKGLLPSGILAVEGTFECGDVVAVKNRQGREIARGISNYDAAELLQLVGRQSGEIQKILGYKAYDEAVHRDNLLITE